MYLRSAVHFIETSDYMRELQRKRFKVEPDYKWDPAVADSSDG